MSIFKSATYFRRNLLSYFIIFFLPIVIFISIYQLRFNDILKEELIRNNHVQLTSLEQNVSSELAQIDAVVNQVNIGSQLAPFKYSDNPNYARDRIDSLKQYTAVNPFIDDILLHYNEDEFVYSSSGSYIIGFTFENVFQFENYTAEALIREMESPGQGITLHGLTLNIYDQVTPINSIVVIQGLTYLGYGHYGSLAFFVNEKHINDIINTTFQNDINATFIYDGQNQLVASAYAKESIAEQTYLNEIAMYDPDDQAAIRKINNEDFLITFTVSPYNNWTYYSLTPVDEALSLAISTQRQFMVIVMVILFIGAIIISLLMTLNYSPIRKLQTLSKTYTDSASPKGHNELDDIQDAIISLSTRNEALNEALIDNRVAAKAYVIGQLISGQTMTREHMDQDLIMKIMDPAVTEYAIMMLHISQDARHWSDMKDTYMSDIESMSNDDLTLLCKENVMTNIITTLVLAKENTSESFQSDLAYIHSQLGKQWQCDITIGTGDFTASLDELPRSYMGASTAIDYRLMVGTGAIIHYSHIVSQLENHTVYPYSDLELFRLAIKRGIPEDVNKTLNDIIDQIQTQQIPIFMARGICYEIINTVIRSYEKLGQDHQELFLKYPDIIAITKYESMHKIIDLVRQISYDVCSSLSKDYDENHQILVSTLKSYIADNYMSQDFSLQSMADHFGKQASNLSYFYKENTGENILEAVTRYRMNSASNLLINSQMPVNQICIRIGYSNVSSFIRRFKQYYKITPGQYRDVHSQEA